MKKWILGAAVAFVALASVSVVWRFSGRLGTEQALASGDSQPAEMTSNADVTFEEYQAGFAAMTECLASFGWVPEQPPRLTSRQVYDYAFYMPNADPGATPEQRKAWETSFGDCRAKNFDRVQFGWELKMTMSEGERQQARDYLGVCMRGRGLQVAEHPTTHDMGNLVRVQPGRSRADYQVFKDCLKETQVRYDLRSVEVP
jgi:hypothetical protein